MLSAASPGAPAGGGVPTISVDVDVERWVIIFEQNPSQRTSHQPGEVPTGEAT